MIARRSCALMLTMISAVVGCGGSTTEKVEEAPSVVEDTSSARAMNDTATPTALPTDPARDITPAASASDCTPACKENQSCNCSCDNSYACNPDSPPPNCGTCKCQCIP